MSTLIDSGQRAQRLLAGDSRRVTLPCSTQDLQSIADEWGTEVSQLVITSCSRVGGQDVVTVRRSHPGQAHDLGLAPAREFSEGQVDDCALCGFELAQHDLGITCPTA